MGNIKNFICDSCGKITSKVQLLARAISAAAH